MRVTTNIIFYLFHLAYLKRLQKYTNWSVWHRQLNINLENTNKAKLGVGNEPTLTLDHVQTCLPASSLKDFLKDFFTQFNFFLQIGISW